MAIIGLLELIDASFSYDNAHNIFENINSRINPGEVFIVVGPNGCGKTTILDALLGLKKLRTGCILLDGEDIKEKKPHELAQKIAYVPQGHIKSFAYNVIDVVVMGRAYAIGNFSPPSEEDYEIAMNSLKKVGMEDFYNREYTTLSGGELQLILIARALTQQSKLLILDEPTAHLDFRHELNVMEVIGDLVINDGISIIMATHFLNQAFFLENKGVKSRVALMNNRVFEHIGIPSEVLTPENLESVFGLIAKVAINEDDGRRYILPIKNSKEKIS